MLSQEIVFGKFLKERRNQLKLSQSQLAAKIGYKNINKGIRRIADIENGRPEHKLTKSIMSCLGVTSEDRELCAQKEALHREQSISKLPRFKPILIWRAMACIYVPVKLPENITQHKELIAYAANLAKAKNSNCCLKLDYDLRYWINKNGDISHADRRLENTPTAKPNIGMLLTTN